MIVMVVGDCCEFVGVFGIVFCVDECYRLVVIEYF